MFRFFSKCEKPAKTKTRRVKLSKLYKYADTTDIFLMIIGTLAGQFCLISVHCFRLTTIFDLAIGTGGEYYSHNIDLWQIECIVLFVVLFPLMLFLYQKVINNLVELGKLQRNLTTDFNMTRNFDSWYRQINLSLR